MFCHIWTKVGDYLSQKVRIIYSWKKEDLHGYRRQGMVLTSGVTFGHQWENGGLIGWRYNNYINFTWVTMNMGPTLFGYTVLQTWVFI